GPSRPPTTTMRASPIPRGQAKHQACPPALNRVELDLLEIRAVRARARGAGVTTGRSRPPAPSLDGDEAGAVRPAHTQEVAAAARRAVKRPDRVVGGSDRPAIDLDDDVARVQARLLGR